MNILSFGAVLWDVIEGREYLGGAPFNVAAHLAQCRVTSFICTRVGNDQRGRRVLLEMDRLGVDRALVTVDPEHPTGFVTVTLAEGQPTYVIHENVAWDFIEINASDLDRLSDLDFRAFCFGTLDQRSEVSQRTLNRLLETLPKMPVLFDVNLRQHYYSADIIRQSLAKSSILKLNHQETGVLGELLYGETLSDEKFARRVAADYGLAVVLVTLGSRGCAVLHDGRNEIVDGRPVRVVDAVGAGDAFSAGFLFKYCQGAAPMEAVRLANELGAFVASQRGAIPDYPDEIREMLTAS